MESFVIKEEIVEFTSDTDSIVKETNNTYYIADFQDAMEFFISQVLKWRDDSELNSNNTYYCISVDEEESNERKAFFEY